MPNLKFLLWTDPKAGLGGWDKLHYFLVSEEGGEDVDPLVTPRCRVFC
jgi:hypothetical protein